MFSGTADNVFFRSNPWARYAAAVIATALAVGFREALDVYLHNHLPYVTFFVAVAAVAWYGGLGPSLLATGLGFLAADWFFTAPRHTFWVTGVGDVVGVASYFMVCLAIALSIHAMHRARRRLVKILESMTEGVVVLDRRWRVTAMNRQAERTTKLGRPTVLGRRHSEVWPDSMSFERQYRQAMQERRPVHFEEYYPPQGQWLEVHAYPYDDGLAIFFRDITDRRQAEDQLRTAKLAAEQAQTFAESTSRAKDQFIAVLSHELRTPLTPALAAVGALQDDARLPDDVREELAMIQRNIALEVRLIADLLDVSRAISGKLHLEKRPVDVAEAIREAARIVSGDLDAKDQVLTLTTPASPYILSGDAARLQQVFWNLLRNAVKFTPRQGRIAVRAEVVPVQRCPLAATPCPLEMGECPLPPEGPSQPGEYNLIVQVIDSGSGIDGTMLPRLFNAFEQGPEGRSFGGLGLGLTICKAVIEMHGGSICAHSDGPGKGATFTVRLPVAQCPLKPQTHPTATAPATPAAAVISATRSLRIVLVEDHADTAKVLRRLLMADGHEVILADSVAAGLAAVERVHPDVLISDLGLPDGSGLDLMRQILARGQRIPAIAISGYGTAADVAKSRAAGFAEHLVKPISSIGALAEALARVAGRHAG